MDQNKGPIRPFQKKNLVPGTKVFNVSVSSLALGGALASYESFK